MIPSDVSSAFRRSLPPKRSRTWTTFLIETAAIGLGYYLLARLGQMLAIDPGNVSPIWPASGFALVVALWRGYGSFAGIWLGGLVGNTWAFFDPATLPDAVGTISTGSAIGLGAAFQACLGAYLLRQVCNGGDCFGRMRDVFSFVGTQSLACLSSATCGALALCMGGIIPWSTFRYTWITWYLGDGVGVLLIVPLIMTWRGSLTLIQDARRAFEAFTILILSILMAMLAFSGSFESSLIFLPLPFVLWAAVRGDQFAVSSLVLCVSTVALWQTLQHKGPFEMDDVNMSLLLAQLYAAIIMITGSAVTAALTERKRTEQLLLTSNSNLVEAELDLQLLAVAFNTKDSIVITDEYGKILRVNESFIQLTGYDLSEVIGRTPSMLRSGVHDDGFYREMWETIRKVGYWEGEVWNRRKDGSTFLQRLTITGVKDRQGKLTHYVGDGQDITAEKQAAANLAAINAARKVQESLLPEKPPFIPGYDIAGAVFPAEHASGDYYDFVSLPGGTIGLIVADVSGHGLGPALLMAQVQAYVRTFADLRDDPVTLLNLANRQFLLTRVENFVTMFLGCLDTAARSLVYAGAGHQGYLLRENGDMTELKPTGIPLGIDSELTLSSVPHVDLQTGDIILLLTDGIEEAANPKGQLFGRERVFELVREHRENPAAEIVDALFCAAREYTQQAPQDDDITAVVVKILTPPTVPTECVA